MLLDDECSGLTTGGDRKTDRAVGRLDLHNQGAQHIDAEAPPALPVLGVAAHGRRNVIVDPMRARLVVVVGTPAAADYAGADLSDQWEWHIPHSNMSTT
jgi:hypothetical protein